MNVRKLAIGVLLLVVVVVGAINLLRNRPSSRPGSPNYTIRTQMSPNTVTQLMVRKIGASNLFAALGNRPLSWAAIESTNYVAYIQNLRDFGCPEETIRDIIITDIAKLYAKKRATVKAQYPPPAFWQTADAWDEGRERNPELQVKLRQLEGEQRALVKELLGVDIDTEWAKFFEDEDVDDQYYGFLPPEKRTSLQGILDKYEALEEQIYERSKGMMLEEDQAQLQQLEKLREAEIAQLLTPQEFQEYEMRNSPIADALRDQLAGFEPNEEEFRRIFELQKTFETQVNMPPGADEEVRSQIHEQAQAALDNELRKVLGEDRFTEYQRAQDADYKTVVQFAERVQMPREVANEVYDLKTRAEQQKEEVEADPNLTDEQRNAALLALARVAEAKVNALMGDHARRYLPIGGHWINDLAAGAGPLQAEVPILQPSPISPPPPPQIPGFPPFAPLPPFPVVPQR